MRSAQANTVALDSRRVHLIILASGLACLSLLFIHSPGTSDVPDFWLRWADNVSRYGLIKGYALNGSDYPPYSSVILYLLAKIASWTGLDFFLCFKLSLVVSLGLTLLLLFRWLGDLSAVAIIGASLWLNGVALAYLDSYFAPLLIASLWLLQRERLGWFAAFFAATCLIKWQPVIVAPVLFLHAVSRARDSKDMARIVLPAMAVVLTTCGVFGWPVIASLQRALTNPFLSGNALNIHWVVSYVFERFFPAVFRPLDNGVVRAVLVNPTHGWPLLIKFGFAVLYLALVAKAWRSRQSFAATLRCALAVYLGYFAFNLGVHENHLVLATLLAGVLAGIGTSWLAWALAVLLISELNLVAFYGFTGTGLGFDRVIGIDVTVLLALANVAVIIYYLVRFFRRPEEVAT